MKRFLALVLVAFTFAFTSVAPVSHAVAAPVGDPGAGKPEAAMDSAMKDSKDTADTDKNETKAKHSGKGHHKGKGKGKHHKKGAAKEEDAGAGK